MKKLSLFSTSCLTFALMTFFFTQITIAQPPAPPDITGCWGFTVNIVDRDWYGLSGSENGSGTFFIAPSGVSNPNTDPNFLIDLPGTDDDFDAWVHDGVFSFYKENVDNCPGAGGNFGREMIIGTVNNTGTRLEGSGMGFDSNLNCGSTWSYSFIATKTSDSPCPSKAMSWMPLLLDE